MSPSAPHPTLPEKIEDEVLAAIDGDERRRDDELRRILDENPEHAATIRAWLHRAEIPVPGEDSSADPETLPRDLGLYRLVELLGRGGFGSVYRAEQREPIRREVAVKVINPGMDSREILDRFLAEREALNRMDHPGIARLLDAGTTEQGRPFFVMELVDGPTLASLCRRRKLGLRERLDLFLGVLDAMQHAHQRAVIHRDLSSNNVLVGENDGRLQPKIIDFGIAKSLADPLLQAGAMTFQGTLMGTPEFMSPEQASGRVGSIDTRSDIYSLGVQLYELLTDQLPIPSVALRAHGVTGIAEVIRTHQPQPPSAVAPRERRAALRGDLDAITMRAIAKDPDERYGSVGDLAADLRRHLAHEPVECAAPSRWSRLLKFVRRHRAESLAALVVAIGLLVAAGVLVWALLIAHEALSETERQKEEIARRADAGFRLLANEDRLRAAKTSARDLPPPWPEHRAAFVDWIDRQGRPLADELQKLRTKIAELEERRRAGGDRFADIADEHLYRALLSLRADLERFVAADGPLERVRSRLALLDEKVAPALARDADAWERVIAAIREEHAGLHLQPMPGLHPLGRNPATGRFEFRDLVTEDTGRPIVFVLVPAGTLHMGARRGRPGLPYNDPDAEDDELGGGLTRLDDFLVARTELTLGQWSALSGRPLPPAGERDLPVTGIDWFEARELLRAFDFDLPTEAQWEYACRAGTTTPWVTGDDPAELTRVAWFGATPRPVAEREANGWGLFDVHGNVAEWCRDLELPYDRVSPRARDGLREDPTAPPGAPRIIRGGACDRDARASRSSAREGRPPSTREPTLGLRPIRFLR